VIQFALLGLGIGGAYALASQGLILIKRGSGVLNFSQGALAAVGAFTYYRLSANGVPAVIAFILALALPALIGVAMHVFLMRPLRNASPLSRLIATLGVMSLIQQVMDLWLGSATQIVSSILPSSTVTIGSSSIS
jgi:branched-subunit amino acid ABC-type transport system permease component